MKPYPCIESTVDILIDPERSLRLWIDRDDVPEVLPAYRQETVVIKEQFVKLKAPDFFVWLKEFIPRLNAAQIQRIDPLAKGNRVFLGTVVYYVAFQDDPHG